MKRLRPSSVNMANHRVVQKLDDEQMMQTESCFICFIGKRIRYTTMPFRSEAAHTALFWRPWRSRPRPLKEGVGKDTQ